jgi:hypothetical protein
MHTVATTPTTGSTRSAAPRVSQTVGRPVTTNQKN